jgi:hypothetical protein
MIAPAIVYSINNEGVKLPARRVWGRTRRRLLQRTSSKNSGSTLHSACASSALLTVTNGVDEGPVRLGLKGRAVVSEMTNW